MNIFINMRRHRWWVKVIATGVLCLFTVNTSLWAYPFERQNLAVQSMFNPILDRIVIRDIGAIRYFLNCLSRTYEDLNSIPGDVNTRINSQGQNVDVQLEFSAKEDSATTGLLGINPGEYIIPCNVAGNRYYAYVTDSLMKSEVSAITVFTQEEFEEIRQKGYIIHGKRTAKEENDIVHEAEQDTPLSIFYEREKNNIKNISGKVQKEVLDFFKAIGANPQFLEEAEIFMSEGNVTIVPDKTAIKLTVGKNTVEIPVEIEKPHASNSHINIPRNLEEKIVQVLIHELSAKCSNPHSFNLELHAFYQTWKEDAQIPVPEKIMPVVSKMNFKDITDVDERDYSFGPGMELTQEVSLERKLTISQQQVLSQLMIRFQRLEQQIHIPPEAASGLMGLRNADKILKEKGAVGIVIGSVAKVLYDSNVVSGEQIKEHSDVDVVVLTPGIELDRFEGGVDWWLPVGLSELEIYCVERYKIGNILVNGNNLYLRAGIRTDYYVGEPGLYLPSREFLIDLTVKVALSYFGSEVWDDEDLLAVFEEKVEESLGENSSLVWKNYFNDKIVEDGYLLKDGFSADTVAEINEQTDYAATEINQKRYENNLGHLKVDAEKAIVDKFKLDISMDSDSPEQVWESLFEDENNAREFFKTASGLRKEYPYELSQKDSRAPLQYALEEGVFFKLGANLFMTPVTESFRRHLIFAADDFGKIKFAFEVVIPGDVVKRMNVQIQSRYEIANQLIDSFPGQGYCVKPLFKKEFLKGKYIFYNGSREFNEACPLKIIAFEYKEDGKRLNNVSPLMFEYIRRRLNLSREKLDLLIANQISRITAGMHLLGYVGNKYLGERGFCTDWHTGNFRLSVDENRMMVKVIFVGDFSGTTKCNTMEEISFGRKIDLRTLLDAYSISERGLKRIIDISSEELQKMFNAQYGDALAEKEDRDIPIGLIGPYITQDSVVFKEISGEDGRFVANFQAYNVKTKKSESVELFAGRALLKTFDGYKRTGSGDLDDKLDLALKNILPKNQFILEINKYGIDGIGQPNLLAIVEPLKENEIALFHEVAYAAGVNVESHIVGGRETLQKYLEGKGDKAEGVMRPHYALRLFQEQKWPEENRELSAWIRAMQMPQEERVELFQQYIKEQTGANQIVEFSPPKNGINSRKVIEEYKRIIELLKNGEIVSFNLTPMKTINETIVRDFGDNLSEKDETIARYGQMNELCSEFFTCLSREIAVGFNKKFEIIERTLMLLFYNAFIHGNRLDLDLPIFLRINSSDEGQMTALEIYDVASTGNLDKEKMTIAKELEMHGKGTSVKSIKKNWGYSRSLIYPNDVLMGTRTVVFFKDIFGDEAWIAEENNLLDFSSMDSLLNVVLKDPDIDDGLDKISYGAGINFKLLAYKMLWKDQKMPREVIEYLNGRIEDCIKREENLKGLPTIGCEVEIWDDLDYEYPLESAKMISKLLNIHLDKPKETESIQIEFAPQAARDWRDVAEMLNTMIDIGMIPMLEGEAFSLHISLSSPTEFGTIMDKNRKAYDVFKEGVGVIAFLEALLAVGDARLEQYLKPDGPRRIYDWLRKRFKNTSAEVTPGIKEERFKGRTEYSVGGVTGDKNIGILINKSETEHCKALRLVQALHTALVSYVNGEVLDERERALLNIYEEFISELKQIVRENKLERLVFINNSEYILRQGGVSRVYNLKKKRPQLVNTFGILTEKYVRQIEEVRDKDEIELLKGQIKKKALKSTRELLGTLFNLGVNHNENEKVLLALDKDLGREGTANFVQEVIDDICELKENKGCEAILQNIVIIRGRGERLAEQIKEYTTDEGKNGVKIEKSNVIMITKNTNYKNCSDFADEAIITFVDDSKMNMMDYYPLSEVVLFTVAKALYTLGIKEYDVDKLLSLYDLLDVERLNVDAISDEEIIKNCIENRSFLLKLKPAEKFDLDELRYIYKNVSKILANA